MLACGARRGEEEDKKRRRVAYNVEPLAVYAEYAAEPVCPRVLESEPTLSDGQSDGSRDLLRPSATRGKTQPKKTLLSQDRGEYASTLLIG